MSMRESTVSTSKTAIMLVGFVFLLVAIIYAVHKDRQRDEWCRAKCYPLRVDHCDYDFVLCAQDKVYRKEEGR